VAGDPNSGAYKQYQRGYQMVNTLFPASLGYTQNALGGRANGENQLVKTGVPPAAVPNIQALSSASNTAAAGGTAADAATAGAQARFRRAPR
jgi:hypothetical protein